MQNAGWRAAHAAQAAFGLTLLVLVSSWLTESLAAKERQNIRASLILSSCKKLINNPGFICPAIIYASCFSVIFIFISGAPGIFISELNFTPLEFSLTIAISSGAVFFGSLLSAKLSKLGISEQRVTSIGCTTILPLVITTSILNLTSTLTTTLLISLMGLVVLCFGVVSPTATHTAMLPIQESKGIATGVLRTLQMAISASASAALPFLLKIIPSIYAVLILMALCSLISIAASMILNYCQDKASLIESETTH